jgi:hypothetical protein
MIHTYGVVDPWAEVVEFAHAAAGDLAVLGAQGPLHVAGVAHCRQADRAVDRR